MEKNDCRPFVSKISCSKQLNTILYGTIHKEKTKKIVCTFQVVTRVTDKMVLKTYSPILSTMYVRLWRIS